MNIKDPKKFDEPDCGIRLESHDEFKKLSEEERAAKFWENFEHCVRLNCNTTLKQFCEMNNLSYKTIANAKSRNRLPCAITVVKMAQAAQMHPEYLIF